MNQPTPVPFLFRDLVRMEMTKDEFEDLVTRHIPAKFRNRFGMLTRSKFITVLMSSAVFPPAPATFDFSAFGATCDARNAGEQKLFIDTALQLGIIERSSQSGRYEVPTNIHQKLKTIFEKYYE